MGEVNSGMAVSGYFRSEPPLIPKGHASSRQWRLFIQLNF